MSVSGLIEVFVLLVSRFFIIFLFWFVMWSLRILFFGKI